MIAFVVSDKAAKTAIEIIWSVTDSISRSAKKNQIENEDVPVAHDGVQIENVEDLDARSQRKFNRRQMDLEER